MFWETLAFGRQFVVCQRTPGCKIELSVAVFGTSVIISVLSEQRVLQYYRVSYDLKILCRASLGLFLKPMLVETKPGFFQPNQLITTFLANISPKPSITPLTKGKRRLTAKDDASARVRVRIEREESKIDKVTDTGA